MSNDRIFKTLEIFLPARLAQIPPRPPLLKGGNSVAYPGFGL